MANIIFGSIDCEVLSNYNLLSRACVEISNKSLIEQMELAGKAFAGVAAVFTPLFILIRYIYNEMKNIETRRVEKFALNENQTDVSARKDLEGSGSVKLSFDELLELEQILIGKGIHEDQMKEIYKIVESIPRRPTFSIAANIDHIITYRNHYNYIVSIFLPRLSQTETEVVESTLDHIENYRFSRAIDILIDFISTDSIIKITDDGRIAMFILIAIACGASYRTADALAILHLARRRSSDPTTVKWIISRRYELRIINRINTKENQGIGNDCLLLLRRVKSNEIRLPAIVTAGFRDIASIRKEFQDTRMLILSGRYYMAKAALERGDLNFRLDEINDIVTEISKVEITDENTDAIDKLKGDTIELKNKLKDQNYILSKLKTNEEMKRLKAEIRGVIEDYNYHE